MRKNITAIYLLKNTLTLIVSIIKIAKNQCQSLYLN